MSAVTARLSLFLGLLLVALPASSVFAQEPFHLGRPDAEDIDTFGAAVDGDGDLVVIGAPGAVVDGPETASPTSTDAMARGGASKPRSPLTTPASSTGRSASALAWPSRAT